MGHEIRATKEIQLPYLRRKIGMVFQDHRLLQKMSISDNLVFALRAGRKRRIRRRKLLAVLRQVGLAHKRKAYPVEFHWGRAAKGGTARALVTNPPYSLSL
ncbi:MAG: hypothetical protein R2865_09860 [Deinococcales bacterium]